MQISKSCLTDEEIAHWKTDYQYKYWLITRHNFSIGIKISRYLLFVFQNINSLTFGNYFKQLLHFILQKGK